MAQDSHNLAQHSSQKALVKMTPKMFQQGPNITQDCQKIDCSFQFNFTLTCPFFIFLLNGGVPKAIHIKLFKNDTHQLTAAWRSTNVCDDSHRLSIHRSSINRQSKESLQSFKLIRHQAHMLLRGLLEAV